MVQFTTQKQHRGLMKFLQMGILSAMCTLDLQWKVMPGRSWRSTSDWKASRGKWNRAVAPVPLGRFYQFIVLTAPLSVRLDGVMEKVHISELEESEAVAYKTDSRVKCFSFTRCAVAAACSSKLYSTALHWGIKPHLCDFQRQFPVEISKEQFSCSN